MTLYTAHRMTVLLRRALAVCVSLALMFALTACGFKLRQSQAYVFETIAVTPATGGPLKSELRRYLGERVVELPAPSVDAGVPQPQVILDILSEPREKVIVGRSSTGQVREFQLRVRVSFRLRTPDGRELIPVTEIVQQRDISFNESAVLAKEAEELLLYRNMQSDLVQQLLRRLGALKTL
ncbi:MAG: hypothetical protein RLZZ591_973 [Pseudomonadota bacterium]